ncbi:MAG: hypothetical protein FH749_06400 [Firmicutes bacterium]|nr:hypothetical protein [Bacillota bacterium]
MENSVFPYHKAIQKTLFKTALIPIVLWGISLMIVTPLLLAFVMDLQNQKSSNAIAIAGGQFARC